MSERRPEERALEQLIDDLRRADTPGVDWDRVEAGLFARVAESVDPRALRPSSRSPRWVLVAAALLGGAAAVMAAYGHGGSGLNEAERYVAKTDLEANTSVNGDTLAIGAPIVARNVQVVVTHRGHATWTLEPNSTAHLETLGDVITVALDQGTLSAHVTKSPRPESFVVRVERTRVAVHGTRFRVERGEGSAHIVVTEGVVGVGPLTRTSQKPFELTAPESAVVDFDGVRADLPESESARGTHKTSELGSIAAKEPARAAPSAPSVPSVPSAREETALGNVEEVNRVESAVRRCFGKVTVARGDLRVTISTRMSLTVDPSGKISKASFEPPLIPTVRACVEHEAKQIVFPASGVGAAVSRVIELER